MVIDCEDSCSAAREHALWPVALDNVVAFACVVRVGSQGRLTGIRQQRLSGLGMLLFYSYYRYSFEN